MIERLEATVDHVLTCQTQALKIGRSLAPNHQYYRVGAPGLSGAPRRHGKIAVNEPKEAMEAEATHLTMTTKMMIPKEEVEVAEAATVEMMTMMMTPLLPLTYRPFTATTQRPHFLLPLIPSPIPPGPPWALMTLM